LLPEPLLLVELSLELVSEVVDILPSELKPENKLKEPRELWELARQRVFRRCSLPRFFRSSWRALL
jgi:hypothetical protein